MKQDASLNLTGIKKNDVFLNKLNQMIAESN